MNATQLQGQLAIPGSKSHTIRALFIAALAGRDRKEHRVEGQDAHQAESVLLSPLVSQDTLSARSMVQQLGAQISEELTANGALQWRVRPIPAAKFDELEPPIVIDVGNSGTALYLGTAVAALFARPVCFDGDNSIRTRSAENLLRALQQLGVRITTEQSHRPYMCPYTVQGPMRGGFTRLAAPTSQYLSALLLALPLLGADCESQIDLDLLNEHPYVDMTLEWLQSQRIQWHSEGYRRYRIRGGQCYRPFCRPIPADFSSATFFFCAAAITGSTLRFTGLDPQDSQGDKQTLELLQRMGCKYRWHQVAGQAVSGLPTPPSYVLEFSGPAQVTAQLPKQPPQKLQAAELDLAASPDALPAMAVACACAHGTSRIYNVAHARHKETDRIACMATELQALGFDVREAPDGLTICGGTETFRRTARRQRISRGYQDHRIIMALSLLNLLQPKSPVVLDDTSYAAVTFPSFFTDLQSLTNQ